MSTLRVFSVVLAAVAVVCMVVAVAGMVTDRHTPRTGYLLRAVAVLCFAGAVALNVAAH
ncbi:MAG: hypothetical protein M3016_06905 [Actinomycetota bacterium]|nr:hypothetical protein [Actinomycetota bacterium]